MPHRQTVASLTTRALSHEPTLWRGRSAVVLVATTVVAIFLLTIAGFEIHRRHEAVLENAIRRTQDIAQLSAEHMARSLEAVDRTLIEAVRVAQDLASGERPRDSDTYEELERIFGHATAIAWLAIHNKDGLRLFGSIGADMPGFNLAQQETLLTHAQTDGEHMQISQPFKPSPEQRKIVLASRRVSDDYGNFLGIVTAGFDLDYFSGMYAALDLGAQGAFSLVLDDATLILRTPFNESHLGVQIADQAAFSAMLARSPFGTRSGISRIDGLERIYSYRRVPDSSLVVFVSFASDEALATWRRNSILAVIVMLTAAVAIMVGGIVLAQAFYRGEIRERVLAAARLEAEEASRAKSEFLAIMSHELRTPMNGVIGYSKLLAGLDLDEQARGYAKTITESATTLLTIVNDILDYSKIEAGKITLEAIPLDLHRLVEDVVALNRPEAAEKSLILKLKYDPRVPEHVIADPTRLRQILINLVGNAIKFTTKGSVSLAVSLEGEEANRSVVRFTVTDTGVGIKEADISRLFRSFTQADSTIGRRFGGTGLGLAICRSLVEMMGGMIGVSSEYGVGSTFWFRLPFAQSMGGEIQMKAGRLDDDILRTGKVLVVDDNLTNRRLVKALLTPSGNKVVDAGSGEEALQKLTTEDFDLVLMDLNMPVMSGLEATMRIRAMEEPKCRIPVVALSASAMAEEIARCTEAGMNGHVAKPIDAAILLRTVSANIRKTA